jgi:hypothetical protein
LETQHFKNDYSSIFIHFFWCSFSKKQAQKVSFPAKSNEIDLIFLLARTLYNLAKDYTTVGDIPTKLRLVGISGVPAGG